MPLGAIHEIPALGQAIGPLLSDYGGVVVEVASRMQLTDRTPWSRHRTGNWGRKSVYVSSRTRYRSLCTQTGMTWLSESALEAPNTGTCS